MTAGEGHYDVQVSPASQALSSEVCLAKVVEGKGEEELNSHFCSVYMYVHCSYRSLVAFPLVYTRTLYMYRVLTPAPYSRTWTTDL